MPYAQHVIELRYVLKGRSGGVMQLQSQRSRRYFFGVLSAGRSESSCRRFMARSRHLQQLITEADTVRHAEQCEWLHSKHLLTKMGRSGCLLIISF